MSAEKELQRLRGQLNEREEQLQKAAQAGLDLLNQQVELQSRLDEQRVEMTNALEVRTRLSLNFMKFKNTHLYNCVCVRPWSRSATPCRRRWS